MNYLGLNQNMKGYIQDQKLLPKMAVRQAQRRASEFVPEIIQKKVLPKIENIVCDLEINIP